MSTGSLCARIDSMHLPDSAEIMIKDLQLEVEPGEIVGVVGPTGAGKSTLLRIVSGLERRYSGQVLLDGESVIGPGRDIQLLFQDLRLLPWMTVEQNLAFAARPGTASADDVDSWLTFVGLNDRRRSWPKELSGGEISRVAFARAFIDRPRVLLLDEPFGALDVATRYALHRHFLAAHSKQPVTVVMVTHNVDDAVALCDRVLCVSSRPMRILESISLAMPRPRPPEDSSTREVASRITARLLSEAESSRITACRGNKIDVPTIQPDRGEQRHGAQIPGIPQSTTLAPE